MERGVRMVENLQTLEIEKRRARNEEREAGSETESIRKGKRLKVDGWLGGETRKG